jgi:hypothetical protein
VRAPHQADGEGAGGNLFRISRIRAPAATRPSIANLSRGSGC